MANRTQVLPPGPNRHAATAFGTRESVSTSAPPAAGRPAHHGRFFRAVGFDQVRLDSTADRHVRAPALLAAIDWAAARLSDTSVFEQQLAGVPLAAMRDPATPCAAPGLSPPGETLVRVEAASVAEAEYSAQSFQVMGTASLNSDHADVAALALARVELPARPAPFEAWRAARSGRRGGRRGRHFVLWPAVDGEPLACKARQPRGRVTPWDVPRLRRSPRCGQPWRWGAAPPCRHDPSATSGRLPSHHPPRAH